MTRFAALATRRRSTCAAVLLLGGLVAGCKSPASTFSSDDAELAYIKVGRMQDFLTKLDGDVDSRAKKPEAASEYACSLVADRDSAVLMQTVIRVQELIHLESDMKGVQGSADVVRYIKSDANLVTPKIEAAQKSWVDQQEKCPGHGFLSWYKSAFDLEFIQDAKDIVALVNRKANPAK